MTRQSKRSTKLAITVILSIFLISAVVSSMAYAFGNRLTYVPDMDAGGTEGAIDLHLKNVSGIARVVKNKLAAYYPKETGRSANGKSLKIIEGKVHRACNIAGYITGDLYIKIVIADNDKTYRVPMQKVCNGSQFYGKTFAFPNGKLIVDNSGYYKANIEVGLESSAADAGRSGSDSNSFNYDIQLAGNNSGKGKLALRANNSEREFGLRSSYADGRENSTGNQTVRAKVAFGYPCNVSGSDLDDPGNRTVKLYDADGVFGDTYMWVTKNGTKLDKDDYIQGRLIDRWNSTYKGWKVKQSNLDYNSLILKRSVVDPDVEYKLVIYNDGRNRTFSPHGNTLSVAIPYDSIYGSATCNYDLKPTVDPPANSSGTVTAGTVISESQLVGHILPEGYDKDNHAWRLTARVYGSKPNTGSISTNSQGACSWRQGKAGSCEVIKSGTRANGFGADDFDKPATYDTSDLEAGEWVCFMMSVQKPKYNSPSTQWRHSAMKCVGIKGSSAGTTVAPDTYSYFPKLTATSNITNDGGYPKVDSYRSKDYQRNEYDWKLMETKFSSKPSSIGTSDRGGCNTVREVGGYLNGSCKVIQSGDNLFPQKSPASCSGTPCTKTASSWGDGPDPIGTWTCYTFSYLTNPKPLGNLMSDIDLFYDDWNDLNNTSRRPARWSDGYYRYRVPAERNKKGKIIKAAYWEYVGTPKSDAERNAVKKSYREANPDSTTPKYKFTPYKLSSCSQSGIDPKVQIRSGDLKVTGGGINTFVRTMEVGNAIGSYGSGGEYGVLSTGLNTGMASASGMLRGLSSGNQTDWSKLTFTNDNPSMRGFGGFDATPSDSRPAVPPGAISLGDGTGFGSTSYAAGQKLVYRVEGTLKITGNLRYPNSVNRVNQIPRVVIYADNIEIAPNVTRIDPWLIADNISTCGPPRGASWGDPASVALGEANLRTGECNNPLIFNGPVYASNIYLYRTGGSRVPKSTLNNAWANPDSGINPDVYCEDGDCGNGPNGRKYALSAPAEVFNLRPDVFLSSFSGKANGVPVATTDKITELPPRF